MNRRSGERWKLGLTLVVWSALILSVGRIARIPAHTPPPVPGEGTWKLVEPFDRPKLGSLVPDITLLSRDGWQCPLAAFRGRPMLLCFFRSDTPDSHLVHAWEKIHRSDLDVVVLGISASGPGGGPNFRKTTHVSFPLVFDPNYHYTKQREPADYPLTALVDQSGKVVYVSHKPDDLSAVIRLLHIAARGDTPK